MTTVMADVERPMRDWLRTLNLDDIGTRVYLGVPEGATYPLIDVTLVEGGVQPGPTPLAVPRFQLSVWGSGPNADRAELQAIAWALASAIQTTDYAESNGTGLMGAEVTTFAGPRYDPDGTPRYLLEVAIAMKVLA